MAVTHGEISKRNVINPEALNQSIMFLKLSDLDERFADLEERLVKVEQNNVLWEDNEAAEEFSVGSERRVRTKKPVSTHKEAKLQECVKIVERSMEILTEWGAAEEIRMQIQYAAIIVAKIDNLKKKDFVQTDDLRRKICTLLRNVIKLNVAEEKFSQEQIEVLRRGFSLVIAEGIQKEDLFQLNRQLRKEGLQTMPAWE